MQFKQKTFHSALIIWSTAVFHWALCIFCIAVPGYAGAQTLSRTFGDQVATLRLLAASGLKAGHYEVGVEIVMSPGSHTYWKQPGEAGVPPVFAFNGSQNVAKATVQFPAPTRIAEEGIQAFGYTAKVVFPVVVTPLDGAKPAVLKVDATYAVCNKICIPAHGTATLTLSPDGGGLDAAAVAAAQALVPRPASEAEYHDLSITREAASAKPSWILVWSGKTPVDDMFAEAPEGFYFDTKRLGPNRFRLIASEIVSTGRTADVPVSLTLVGKDGSVVVTESLDATVATR